MASSTPSKMVAIKYKVSLVDDQDFGPKSLCSCSSSLLSCNPLSLVRGFHISLLSTPKYLTRMEVGFCCCWTVEGKIVFTMRENFLHSVMSLFPPVFDKIKVFMDRMKVRGQNFGIVRQVTSNMIERGSLLGR